MIGSPFQQEVLQRLSELCPIYIVGGAVRDAQLGVPFNPQRIEDFLDLWRADSLGVEQDVERNQKRLDRVQGEIRQASVFLTERACLLDWRFFKEFAHGKGLEGERFGQFKEQVRNKVMINDKLSPKDLQFLETEYELFRT